MPAYRTAAYHVRPAARFAPVARASAYRPRSWATPARYYGARRQVISGAWRQHGFRQTLRQSPVIRPATVSRAATVAGSFNTSAYANSPAQAYANGSETIVAPRPAVVRATGTYGGVQTGNASYYGGGRTASGGMVGAATCAHRTLPFGTRVMVTNLANSRTAVLTVNDRGPFVGGRIIDVSTGAAATLGMLHSGTAPVRVQVVGGAG